MTESEYDKLVEDYGEEKTKAAINHLDRYIERKGYKVNNCDLTLREWVFDAVKEREKTDNDDSKTEEFLRKWGLGL